jgi:hypothetical protein
MINIDLNNIKKWGDTWLVKFNPNKSEIMIFNIRNQQDELSFDFDGIVLNSVNNVGKKSTESKHVIGNVIYEY